MSWRISRVPIDVCWYYPRLKRILRQFLILLQYQANPTTINITSRYDEWDVRCADDCLKKYTTFHKWCTGCRTHVGMTSQVRAHYFFISCLAAGCDIHVVWTQLQILCQGRTYDIFLFFYFLYKGWGVVEKCLWFVLHIKILNL